MLTLWGDKERFCDGITRRGFLRIGAFGAGLSLAEMLRLRALAATGPIAAAPTKSAIMIYLGGGPSHIDMYDLKPNAPKEIRGEFNPIATNVPGIDICELFPRQAQLFDKLAVIRSIESVGEHSDSLVMTGYSERENRTASHPSFGSVVSRLRSESGSASTVPPYVSLRGMSRGTEPGFLGVSHRPFTPSGPGLENLKLGIDAGRLEDRKSLLQSFDTARREIDASGTMAGLDSFTSRAFDMIASGAVHKALDLSLEDPKTRERYKGIESFLTARRLIEAGVGCVTLSYGGWDTHSNNFVTLRKQLPMIDAAIANLIEDLEARGLQDEVVTVMWGEFGRTPKINNSGGGGRDHWPAVMSALIAGGGMKMGQAIGASTAGGERPKDRPVTVPQVLSTIYRTIGIDPALTFRNGSGRPMYILDDRTPVSELL
jgi:hypothetical protein